MNYPVYASGGCKDGFVKKKKKTICPQAAKGYFSSIGGCAKYSSEVLV